MASSMIGNQVLVLGAKIRVVDKVPPQMAWLNPRHSESFASPAVEFCHANLINKASAEKAFSDSGDFDFVINLAAETKYGQSEPVYKEGIFRLSMNCAELAAKHKVKKYIEVSTAQVYSHEKHNGDRKRASSKKYFSANKGAHVGPPAFPPHANNIQICVEGEYGLGDRNGLTPRLIIGAIYKYMKQKMQMLWTKDLKMNTVHVDDAVRALWHLCFHGNRGQVYNLCDKGDTSQGLISSLISELFDINYDFLGSVFSNLARVRMTDIVDDINEKHVRPWSDACQRDKITNTPLNPFIDQELLYNKHLYVDGSKIESLGFTYHVPRLEVSSLKSILDDYIGLGLMPSSLVSNEVFYTPPEHDEAGIDAGGDGDASSDLAEDTTSS
uniref:NAD-dependent epimerase/dehydratase domain-containing protein n=1 Tax=Biomphalaria glabrata TaxID=6526 RepID=A0A2C9L0A8_BIOGL